MGGLLRMGAALFLAVALLSWGCGDRRVAEAPKEAAQVTYGQYIQVSDVRMSAAENFLGQTVTYLEAKITNTGTQTVVQLELDMEFVDILNQVVLRETTRPITLRTPALKPGETRTFQVSFEHMPLDWNQGAPRFQVKSIQLR